MGIAGGDSLRQLALWLRHERIAILRIPSALFHHFLDSLDGTERFPHEWYDSPNIHFLSVLDFESLAARQGWRIEKRVFVSKQKQVTSFPNLMAEVAVFLVSAQPNSK